MQREGDSTLMSLFIESGYGASDLAQLNRCRLYHQVFFLSDITSANGKVIDALYRTKQGNPSRKSTWKWPTQGMPDRAAWVLWGRAISHFEHNGKLRLALGEWKTASHQEWAWQMHLPTQILRYQTEDQIRYYRPMIAGSTRRAAQLYSLDTFDTANELLEQAEDNGWAAATPCLDADEGGIFSVQYSTAFFATKILETTPATTPNLQEHMARAPLYFLRLIGPIQELTEGTQHAIRTYIEDGTLLTCSDGSFDPELGTGSQAWLFADKTGHLLWSGAGPIDGNPDMVTSYRSKLGGITTILFLLQQIVAFFGISTGAVTLYCDNQGALDNVFDEYPRRGIYPKLERDYDLLGAARAIWRNLPIKVTGVWVKGHYTGPNREVQHDLNDMADLLAGYFQQAPLEGYKQRRVPLNHPEYEAVLYHSGSAVTTKFKDIIYHQSFADDLAANIQRKRDGRSINLIV